MPNVNAVKTYDPMLLDASFAGIPLNKGLSDGTFFTITPTSEGFTFKVGVDGEVTRVRKHDRTAEVTFTTMQSSDVNDRLSAVYRAARLATNGQGVGAFLLVDRAGTTVIQAAKAWISQEPTVSFSGDVETREWTITLGDMDATHGGNSDS